MTTETETKPSDATPIVGDPSAALFQGNGTAGAVAIEERPHLDMKPEDMFPDDGKVDVSTLINMFSHDEPDDGPRDSWIYRVTQELQEAEVLRLFQVAPHLITRRVTAAIDEVYGNMAARLLKAPIPGADARYVHPRSRSRLRRLAERFADRFLDMVPRAQLEFERKLFKAQLDYREARAKIQGAVDMSGDLRDKVVEIERRIFPAMKAPTRVGKTWRGERVVAVWAGIDEDTGKSTEPTTEPKF